MSQTHATGSFDTESSPRPSKRLCLESIPQSQPAVIDLREDTPSDITAASRPRSRRLSSQSVQQIPKPKLKRYFGLSSSPSEFRQVEKQVSSYRHHRDRRVQKKGPPSPGEDDELDPKFTLHAAKERRSAANSTGIAFLNGFSPREATLEGSNEASSGNSVYIANNRDIKQIQDIRHSRSFPVTTTMVSRERQSILDRESPDELQGEATVPSVSPRLALLRKQDAGQSSVPSDTKETRPSLRISPSNIKPTAFLPLSRRDSTKQGRKKGGPDESPNNSQRFGATFVRAGSVEHSAASNAQPLEVCVDCSRKTIAFPRLVDKLDGTSTFPLAKVIGLDQGDDASLKVRLRLSKAEEIPEMIDMELLTLKHKEDLCALLKAREVRINTRSK